MRLGEEWIERVRELQLRTPIDPSGMDWEPEEIVLTRGCDGRAHEAAHCERIIAAFPDVRLVDARHIPHSRVPVPGTDALERLRRGKRTLVVGRMGHPVSPNADPESGAGTLCTRYYAVHPTWFCAYDCTLCYLCGSPGVRFSPTVRIFTNLTDILQAMARVLATQDGPVSFYVGKVQDGLQLDPLGLYSQVLIPFVRAHPKAHLVFLTKSTAVDGVLRAWKNCGAELEKAAGRIAVSWSLNPPEVAERYEFGAPSFAERLAAAKRCADAGLEVRYVFMPLLPVPGWREAYAHAVREALSVVRPTRVTLGGVCSYPAALGTTRARLGACELLTRIGPGHGRRQRFDLVTRTEMYRHLKDCIADVDPTVPVSLCLESAAAWEGAGLDPRCCQCNCIAGGWDLTLR